MNAQILTLSSKGQISLPIAIRRNLNIDTGDKLAVYTSGDVVMLKVLRLPNLEEISETLDEAKEWAETVGYKKSDVNNIIKSVRRKKRK